VPSKRRKINTGHFMNILKRIQMSIRWKLFFTLLTASVLGTFAVFPYVLTPETLKKITVSLWLFYPAQLIQAGLMYGICIFIGLFLAKKVGLGVPLLEDYFAGNTIGADRLWQLLKTGLMCGVLVGITIFVVDISCFARVTASLTQSFHPALWMRFLAAFYGGICEEILMRLFLMSTLVWLFFKLKKSALSIWLAIIITAILFGVGHLPMTARFVALSPVVILRALILNGIAGIPFGWLYWKNGLETAMVAHFTTDIVLYVVLLSLVLK
jgi:membrane protease YdiL (CAAX protease family)